MNIPALPLQTGEDEEGQTFEIIFSAKGWAGTFQLVPFSEQARFSP